MEFIDFLENEIDTRLEGSGLRVVVFEGEEDFIAKFKNLKLVSTAIPKPKKEAKVESKANYTDGFGE